MTICRHREIMIPAGTKVQRDDSVLITLRADVWVAARRTKDGCWLYELRGHYYICAGGLAHVLNVASAA